MDGSFSTSRPPAPIVLAAFGTTVPQARRAYDVVEADVRERWPDREVRWTFTSSFVRRALAEEGTRVLAPGALLAELLSEGHQGVIVQSLHVTAGQEFHRLTATTVEGLRITFGRPLLDSNADQVRVLEILAKEVAEDCPTVFIGHGNEHHPEFNETNLAMAARIKQRFSRAILASLEGEPGPAALEAIKQEARKRGMVHFVPLLFVAGDHVLDDVMGDEPDSWKKRLRVETVTCSPPLGENPEIIEIYLEHLARAIRADRDAS